MGHLKSGVTPARRLAGISTPLAPGSQKTYPKETTARCFSLARPGLMGDFLGKAVRAFVRA